MTTANGRTASEKTQSEKPDQEMASAAPDNAVPVTVPPSQDGQEDNEASAPFSVFSIAQKRLIVLIAAFTTLLPPLTGSMYYPVIPMLARDLHVSVTDINYTITAYLVSA